MKSFLPTFLLLAAFASADQSSGFWKFGTSMNGWKREGSEAPENTISTIPNKGVAILTRANTWDRIKITTEARDFGAGIYTWRVYLPEMGMNDMASIGAFIYKDDQHEADFEIGSGNSATRAAHKAEPDELICYCTNQQFPYSSSIFKLKAGSWYTLKLELVPRPDGNLTIRWSIDNKQLKELATQIPASTRFGIHCSVENLKFLGDHQPTRDHRALFEKVTFTAHR